jgi:hypothetical protein
MLEARAANILLRTRKLTFLVVVTRMYDIQHLEIFSAQLQFLFQLLFAKTFISAAGNVAQIGQILALDIQHELTVIPSRTPVPLVVQDLC